MAGFRKANAKQAFLKYALYGAPGSGKTFTALLIAEGLAALTGKRIAVVDTERGTDFYSKTVAERRIHPEAFDFDALYTRSLTEVLSNVRMLSPDEYAIVIIDSMTHLWEAAKSAYSGKTTSGGQIPFHAWGKIKKPYKDLVNHIMSSQIHAIICGRQGTDFAEDEDTGELKNVGYKMKAESETPYEPHILLRMEAIKQGKNKPALITAYAEKDRTGILAGKMIANPTFDNLAGPILPLLGGKQAKMQSEDEAAAVDAENIATADVERQEKSQDLYERFCAKLKLADTIEDVKKIGKEITKDVKAQMTREHVKELRQKYLEAEKGFSGGAKKDWKKEVPKDAFDGKQQKEKPQNKSPVDMRAVEIVAKIQHELTEREIGEPLFFKWMGQLGIDTNKDLIMNAPADLEKLLAKCQSFK